MLTRYRISLAVLATAAIALPTTLTLASHSPRAANQAEVSQEHVQLMREMATLFRAARKVVSVHQKAINDPDVGDKGLGPDAVIAQALKNYEAATGAALPEPSEGSLAGDARAAMLAAIGKVMADAQPLINEHGKGFKGFLPAVFAKRVADEFSKHMEGRMFIKLTAPKAYVRNRANRPDSWEHTVIEESFKSENWPNGQDLVEVAARKGKQAERLILPEYYGESCLKCHGTPAGELDITGGKKEGGKLGELGGAISVGIYR